jgi:hypothetical protein
MGSVSEVCKFRGEDNKRRVLRSEKKKLAIHTPWTGVEEL